MSQSVKQETRVDNELPMTQRKGSLCWSTEAKPRYETSCRCHLIWQFIVGEGWTRTGRPAVCVNGSILTLNWAASHHQRVQSEATVRSGATCSNSREKGLVVLLTSNFIQSRFRDEGRALSWSCEFFTSCPDYDHEDSEPTDGAPLYKKKSGLLDPAERLWFRRVSDLPAVCWLRLSFSSSLLSIMTASSFFFLGWTWQEVSRSERLMLPAGLAGSTVCWFWVHQL